LAGYLGVDPTILYLGHTQAGESKRDLFLAGPPSSTNPLLLRFKGESGQRSRADLEKHWWADFEDHWRIDLERYLRDDLEGHRPDDLVRHLVARFKTFWAADPNIRLWGHRRASESEYGLFLMHSSSPTDRLSLVLFEGESVHKADLEEYLSRFHAGMSVRLYLMWLPIRIERERLPDDLAIYLIDTVQEPWRSGGR
jgi:hypothetical protein